MQYEFYVVRICPETTVQAALEAPAVLPAGGSPRRPLGQETCYALETAIGLLHGEVERYEETGRVEFNLPTEAVRLTLDEDELGVVVARGLTGQRARQVLEMVWDLLNDCQKRGLTVYDNHLGRALDTASDFEEVLEAYAPSKSHGRSSTRPWWKFWAAA